MVAVVSDLDPGIERAVRALQDAGCETFESCQGGAGHSYPDPAIRFGVGRPEEGWKALAVCLTLGYPVLRLRLCWDVEHGHVPTGPYWEIVFSKSID
jgi:hypothetical protein